MDDSPPHKAKVSELLAQFAAAHADGRVSVGALAEGFGERAFGALMLILALPNAVGLGTIPGLSTVFGLPQTFLALQMVMGLERPWLPGWLAQRSLSGADFRLVVARAMPHLLRMERALKPRLSVVSSRPFERVLGVAFVVLATIVSLPIPFGNQPPAIAMAIMSLGLIEEDGVYVIGGFILGVLATALAMAVILGGAAALFLLLDRLFA